MITGKQKDVAKTIFYFEQVKNVSVFIGQMIICGLDKPVRMSPKTSLGIERILMLLPKIGIRLKELSRRYDRHVNE